MWVLLPWDPGRLALYMLCLSVSWFRGLQVQIVPRRSSPVLLLSSYRGRTCFRVLWHWAHAVVMQLISHPMYVRRLACLDPSAALWEVLRPFLAARTWPVRCLFDLLDPRLSVPQALGRVFGDVCSSQCLDVRSRRWLGLWSLWLILVAYKNKAQCFCTQGRNVRLQRCMQLVPARTATVRVRCQPCCTAHDSRPSTQCCTASRKCCPWLCSCMAP